MQTKWKLGAALILGAFIPGGIAADAEIKAVTIDDCVQQALQKNLDIRIERINPQLARLSVSGSYSVYEPTFTASVDHSFNSSPGSVDAQGRQYPSSERDTDSVTFGLNGYLPSGMTYSIGASMADTTVPSTSYLLDPLTPPSYTTNYLNVVLPGPPMVYNGQMQVLTPIATIPTTSIYENSTAFVGIQMTQPLLKNFWIDSARLAITLRKKDLKISELALEARLMKTVSDVQVAYYDLISAEENVKVQEKALQLAEQLLKENQTRVRVGVLAPLDEKQAESEVAARRADLTSVRNVLQVRQNALKRLLTDDFAAMQDIQFKPSENLASSVQVFSRQDSWHKGLTMRPELLEARLGLEKQNISIKYLKNQIFPQLDLKGSYGRNGSSREFSGAFAGVADGGSPAYSYGVVLTVPLGERQNRVNLRSAKATLEQQLLTLKRLELQIMADIDDAVVTAQSSLERVDATRKAVQFAEAALEAEQKKLDNGKSTSFQVLQFQRDLTSRRSEVIRALTDYNTSLVRLSESEGSTLQRSGIKIELK